MRKWSKEFTCRRCGKQFKATFGDAILPKDQQLMRYPLCIRCRLFVRIPIRPNRQNEKDDKKTAE